MNLVIDKIINICEERGKEVVIDFCNDNWRKQISNSAGWYFIKTNTPINVLQQVGNPKGKNHYNIPKRIQEALLVQWDGLVIKQHSDDNYVVYNGHAQNLKSRAREHIKGHLKTGCLSLSQYSSIKNYNWLFCYLPVSLLGNEYSDNKILRNSVEQGWRGKYGWPILCKE